MKKYLCLFPIGFVNSFNIVGTGDLIMAGACAGPNMLDQLLEMYGFKDDMDIPNIINLGHNSDENDKDGCATVQRDIPDSFWNTDEFAKTLTSDADIIVISLGVCDAINGNWNEGSEDKFRQDYKALLQTY